MDRFDVYVHQERIAMPAEKGWVVTVIRQRDCRMQQFVGWEHQFAATAAGDAVCQSVEFAGARCVLHTVGEHPEYDRAPAYPEPGEFHEMTPELRSL